ncbi:hypothetical protein O3M35_012077 [Rhynocoris fuscipes]|uniref:Uncharacterized protein n=1 Tax=Rhynocoris fuscipes TaxID=488301 RepID=A0AAW1CSE1_9HEMI
MSSSNTYQYWTILIVLLALVCERFCDDELSLCNGNSSRSCINHKITTVLQKISQIPEMKVTNWLSVVPCDNCIESAEDSLKQEISRDTNDIGLLDIIGKAMDTFIETRTLRIILPSWVQAKDGALNVQFGQAMQEGRRRGGKKGGATGLLLMSMLGKMALMSMMLVKFKAMKALMIAAIALVLSKVQLFRMMTAKTGRNAGDGGAHVIVLKETGSGGGHGGGGSGGSHHGGSFAGIHGETVHVIHESVPATGAHWNGAESWGAGAVTGAHIGAGNWNTAGGNGGNIHAASGWGRSALKDTYARVQNITAM